VHLPCSGRRCAGAIPVNAPVGRLTTALSQRVPSHVVIRSHRIALHCISAALSLPAMMPRCWTLDTKPRRHGVLACAFLPHRRSPSSSLALDDSPTTSVRLRSPHAELLPLRLASAYQHACDFRSCAPSIANPHVESSSLPCAGPTCPYAIRSYKRNCSLALRPRHHPSIRR
jgi:hypothetical protein